MLNFSGSTKKRVVNLGDKKTPRGRNFLEQSKLDRLQRESARHKEKSALLISRYVSRRLELLQCSDTFLHQWQAGPPKEYLAYKKALQFDFIAKFGRRDDPLLLLNSLYRIFDIGDTTPQTKSVFFRALARALERVSSPLLVVNCLESLCERYGPPPDFAGKKQLVRSLTLLFSKIGDTSIVSTVFMLEPCDGQLIPFLAIIHESLLPTSLQAINIINASLRKNDASLQISKLTDRQKLQLLLNAITVVKEQKDFRVHATILSQSHFSIVYSGDDEPSGDEFINRNILEVSESAILTIKELYTPTHINHALEMLASSVDFPMAIQSLSVLMNLIPEYRPRVCMLMSITPGLQTWLFSKLSESPAFVSIEGSEEDYLTSEKLSQLVGLSYKVYFWDLLYVYQQLLSYWIIVANNFADNSLQPFTLDQFVKFCKFSKHLCLTLLFNSNESSLSAVQDWRDLKESSISLLNQLYMADLHLKYLPRDFWKLLLTKFEMNILIQIILEEDALRLLQESDSSDDEYRAVGFYRFRKSSKPRSADITSKLEILSRVPFFVDFFDRVRVFQSLLKADQNRILSRSDVAMFYEGVNDKLTADVHRKTILKDAFDQLHTTGSNLKSKIQVTFHNEHGPEAGIDGGGLTKEFLTSVVKEGFSPTCDLHLFKESEAENELYPNNDVYLNIAKKIDLPEQAQRLQYLRFLGMVVGKCLYESVLIDVAFAPFFLANWKVGCTAQSSIGNLSLLDTELFASLSKLLTMTAGEIEALDLSFVINEQVGSDVLQYDLAPPSGEVTPVTKSNRLQYVHLIANFKLKQSLNIQTKYFLEGLFELIDAQWLSMFDPLELQMLISGVNDIDVQDWKQNVHYGGYYDDDVTVNLFWEVVEEMTPQERCSLVKFVTSVSRAPLLGFKALTPKFGLHNSGSPDRLPTASTCVNLLKLPDYKDKQLIRDKLLYATQANSGFDLS